MVKPLAALNTETSAKFDFTMCIGELRVRKNLGPPRLR